jgi:hypothetical protein
VIEATRGEFNGVWIGSVIHNDNNYTKDDSNKESWNLTGEGHFKERKVK